MFELIVILVAALMLLWQLHFAFDALLHIRRVAWLHEVDPIQTHAAPSVSVIIAARNEEQAIENALRSVLAQDYPDFEVIVVNDRSEDGTGNLLDRLARRDSRLKVDTVSQLPPGWLGKNHALHHGASQARGEWLLFTDADVVMEPSTLRRALRYATANSVDHLSAPPRVVMSGLLLEAWAGLFGYLFTAYCRPWRIRDPKSSAHAGIGAFNLVRAATYRVIGGHSRIALRPDDDMKLGKLIKADGHRSDFVFGPKLLSVAWYHSVPEVIEGLRKNMFAGAEYRLSSVLLTILSLLALTVWPFAALFVFPGGPAFWLNAALVLSAAVMFLHYAPLIGIRRLAFLAYPVAGLLFAYIVARSCLLTLAEGGIRWRGTFYSLDQLRENRV